MKIATMIANILVRDFHVEMSDYCSIDISPDTHVMRVMKRLGLVNEKAERENVVYKARELNPDFPGIIDYSCWEIGREWCHPTNPECDKCIVKNVCNKMLSC